MAEKEQSEVSLPLVWIDPDTSEVLFVNQLLVQRQEQEYILTFGQQAPPLISGTMEERAAQAKDIPYVPIRVAVRLGTTTQRLKEFVKVMQLLLAQQAAVEKDE